MAKEIKTEMFHRTMDITSTDDSTSAVSFSSELPVFRVSPEIGEYMEVLDHERGADISFLNNGGPVFVNHNRNDQIGAIERGSAQIGDKRGRANIRYSRSVRGQEIKQDVKDGIRKFTSVGYHVGKLIPENRNIDGIPVYRANWKAMEVSIVGIPADDTVGVGIRDSSNVDARQFVTVVEETANQTTEPISIKIMETPQAPIPQAPAPVPAPARVERGAPTPEIPAHMLSERVREIRAIAAYFRDKVDGVDTLALQAELAEWPVSEFKARVYDRIPQNKPVNGQTEGERPGAREMHKHYSLARAILQQAEGKLCGLERELSDETARQYGQQPSGFFVPGYALAQNMERTVWVAGTGTVGGFAVQTTNLGSEFVTLLRNKAQVMALGARSLILATPTTIPRQNTAGTANWVGETVAATASIGDFRQFTLTPNCITAWQNYGKQLLATSDPTIDGLVRDDILNIIALAIDLAALHGSGSGQPTGLISTTGVSSVILATDGLGINNATAYPAMVSLESLVSVQNADQGALAYLMRSKVRGQLRTAQRFASTDSPVWTNYISGPGVIPGNGSNDGVVNGYRAAVSNQVSAGLTTGTATTISSPVFFGNWNDLLVGHFYGGATDLVVDQMTLAQNRIVRIIASHFVDIGVRRPASFAVLGGVLNG